MRTTQHATQDTTTSSDATRIRSDMNSSSSSKRASSSSQKRSRAKLEIPQQGKDNVESHISPKTKKSLRTWSPFPEAPNHKIQFDEFFPLSGKMVRFEFPEQKEYALSNRMVNTRNPPSNTTHQNMKTTPRAASSRSSAPPVPSAKFLLFCFHIGSSLLAYLFSHLVNTTIQQYDSRAGESIPPFEKLFLQMTHFYWHIQMATQGMLALLHLRYYWRRRANAAHQKPTTHYMSKNTSTTTNFFFQLLFATGTVFSALWFVAVLLLQWHPESMQFSRRRHLTLNLASEYQKGFASEYFTLVLFVVSMTINMFAVIMSTEEFVKMRMLRMMPTWKSLLMFNAVILGISYWNCAYKADVKLFFELLRENVTAELWKKRLLSLGSIILLMLNVAFLAGLYLRRLILEFYRDIVTKKTKRTRSDEGLHLN